MTSSKITAVVLAKNEESMIEGCLDSLTFVDKVIVVDNASTDKTRDIAKKRGASVISTDIDSFSKRRELPLEKISSGYVLYVDADERVTSELQHELVSLVSQKDVLSAYRIPRKNYYLGKNPWPTTEYLERFFKRSALKGWKGELHETAVVSGTVGQLKNPLVHYTHRDLSSMVEKTNMWSDTEALLRLHAHHPPVSWWRFPRVMLTAFFDSYIRQQGWKIGLPGLIESIYQAFSSFITYAKLWELQQQEKTT